MRFLKRPDDAKGEDLTHEVRDKVNDILTQIKENGWEALSKISKSLDGITPFRIDPEDMAKAWDDLPSNLKEALKVAEKNIRTFHRAQRNIFKNFECDIAEGQIAGMRFVPVKSTAVYVPGGRYPLPSSVLMGVIPAQEAGVERIVIVTPPGKEGSPSPVTLAAMGLLDVNEAWVVGGAQAIAAAAFGAGDIKRVDFIVGPGNAFVTEAKRQVFGVVGIDGLAGPSEVLIVADESANPKFLAADMLAQLEHDPSAKAMLLVTEEMLAIKAIEEVRHLLSDLKTASVASLSWEKGATVAVGSLEEIADFANDISPEHLELVIKEPDSKLELFSSYGAAFLGQHSAVPFGDYIAGTNHVLPTGGSAKFQGGLWVGTFLRPMQHLYLSQKAASDLALHGATIAGAEGLSAHDTAMRLRRDF